MASRKRARRRIGSAHDQSSTTQASIHDAPPPLPSASEAERLPACVAEVLHLWQTAADQHCPIPLPTLLRRFERLWWDMVVQRNASTRVLRDVGRREITHAVRSARSLAS